MISLRLRLVLGYGYLVALLLLTAGSAVFGFLHLSAGIDRVLEENYRSIAASMTMLEALERQDSATLAALLDPTEELTRELDDELDRLDSGFQTALETAQKNVTEKDERGILTLIEEGFKTYRRQRSELLRVPPAEPLDTYRQEVLPPFLDTRREVRRLLEVNQEAMVEADRRARQSAAASGAWLGFLVTLALLSLVFFSRALQRQILGRLSDLREATGAILGGDARRRLPAAGSDELSLLARSLNQALDRQEELRAQMEGRLCEARQISLGLADRLGPGHAVLGLDGSVLMKGNEGLPDGDLEKLGAWVREEGRTALAESPPSPAGPQATVKGEEGEGAARRYHLVALWANGRRPVGWLAEAESGEG